MKNHLVDLHNHLFAQIERLGDEELSDAELAKEINRANAIVNVSGQIVANANVIMRATICVDSAMGDVQLPLLTEYKGTSLHERREQRRLS